MSRSFIFTHIQKCSHINMAHTAEASRRGSIVQKMTHVQPPVFTANTVCIRALHKQRAKKKVVLLVLSEWAVEKQQLQYNLMGNKFPFLLSTWPPATNPGAGRVVNFHGKVVNFHKQQPFLCFRHAFPSPSLFFSKAWDV